MINQFISLGVANELLKFKDIRLNRIIRSSVNVHVEFVKSVVGHDLNITNTLLYFVGHGTATLGVLTFRSI